MLLQPFYSKEKRLDLVLFPIRYWFWAYLPRPSLKKAWDFFPFFEYPLYAAYLGIIRERQSVYDSCHSTKCVRILGAWLDASDANTWWNPDVILRLAKSSNDKYNDYAQRYFWFVSVKWKLLLAIWVKLVYNYFK